MFLSLITNESPQFVLCRRHSASGAYQSRDWRSIAGRSCESAGILHHDNVNTLKECGAEPFTPRESAIGQREQSGGVSLCINIVRASELLSKDASSGHTSRPGHFPFFRQPLFSIVQISFDLTLQEK